MSQPAALTTAYLDVIWHHATQAGLGAQWTAYLAHSAIQKAPAASAPLTAQVAALLPEGVLDSAYEAFLEHLIEDGQLALLPELSQRFQGRVLQAEVGYPLSVGASVSPAPVADDITRIAQSLRRRLEGEAGPPRLAGNSLSAVDEIIRVRLQHDALWGALTVSEGELFTTWSADAEARMRAKWGNPDSSAGAGVAFYSHLIAEARQTFFPEAPVTTEAQASSRLHALARAMLPLLMYLRANVRSGEDTVAALQVLSLPDLVGMVQRPNLAPEAHTAVRTYLNTLPGYPWFTAPSPDAERLHQDTLREFLRQWHRRTQILAGPSMEVS